MKTKVKVSKEEVSVPEQEGQLDPVARDLLALYDHAKQETSRFLRILAQATERVLFDPRMAQGCKDTAAVKRAAADLRDMLARVKRGK